MRMATKAIIRKDDQLLLIKFEDERGVQYGFPGGGQEHGETLHQAIVRECLEEIGQDVEPLALLYVREYIGANHGLSDRESAFHQVECYFECKLLSDRPFDSASVPDTNQIGVEWVPLEQLDDIMLVPQSLGRIIRSGEASPVYVGDIN
ncbi:NUDIX domain-containing protein [Paenibacillus curdlanolyticus]|uniref:NUDIX domain-containing protein n=1 Tax=Paenibacillus curdlanolyticus TaxID=59840 RepID=UPI001F164184|nr:NUDIX domain-containing protein [Paenibacillus curdlanolyticus]